MARPSSPPYGERVLRFDADCEGLDVWELQIKLIGWGSGPDADGIGAPMMPVRVTGTFDRATRDAVRRFQNAVSLDVTGVVDGAVFRELDREAARYPVLAHDMRCPCTTEANDGPILCRCDEHPNEGKCTGFGDGRSAGEFRLAGKKLPDKVDLDKTGLDIYDMEEYEGIDKALLWAVRALMRRATVNTIKVTAGYRCWHDNYHHTDERRWHHRVSTFHMGKAVEFHHLGTCTEWGQNPAVTVPCAECARIRNVATDKCGFQLRFHEPNRVSVAEGDSEMPPPTTPWAVHVNTVRRVDREKDEFVKIDADALAPLYEGKILGTSLPLDLGQGLDPRAAPSEDLFNNAESKKGGWFPVGASRMWHGGIHVYAGAGTEVRAMFDGEVVACRVGEADNAKTLGSRNFVLLKHTWKTKEFYTLYMHLDAEAAAANSTVAWRKQLHLRTKDHVEVLKPAPFFTLVPDADAIDRFVPQAGLGPGQRVEVTGAAGDAQAEDDKAPDDSEVIELVNPASTYVFTKREDEDFCDVKTPIGGLDAKLAGDVIGLDDPIKVQAGEVVGKVAAAPTDASLAGLGTFVHVEAFSADNLLTESGFVQLDGSADNPADAKKVIEALVAAKLLAEPEDGVLLPEEWKDVFGKDPNRGRFRNAVLKLKSAWDTEWKTSFSSAETLGFMKDVDRDALGDKFDEYCWWADAAGDAGLPGSTVHHYHPITLLLHIAFSTE